MKARRFVLAVWGLNGVGLMLLLLIGFGEIVSKFLRERVSQPKPPAITNVADDPKGEERWNLGSPVDVAGTPWSIFPLLSEKIEVTVEQPSHAYFREPYIYASRNLLFLNNETRAMHWFSSHNNQVITQFEFVTTHPRDFESNIGAILYHIVTRDTDGDHRITSKDTADLALSHVDGTGSKVVASAVEKVLAKRVRDKRDLLILYQAKGRGYASLIGLEDLVIRETKEIPRVE